MRRSFVRSRRPVREDAFDQVRALERARRRDAARAPRDRDLRPRRRRAGSDAQLRGARSPLSGADRRGARVPGRRPTGRSGSPTCPAGWTTRGASCWGAGSCARAFSGSARTDDVAARPLRRLGAAREKREVAQLLLDVDCVGAAVCRRTRPRQEPPLRSTFSSDRSSIPVSPVASLTLRSAACTGERVDRAASVVLEQHASREVLVQHGAGGLPVDASVVEALRQADEVSREAIAADVRHLPGPVGLELVPQRLVQRPAKTGAARIVLAVRADEKERLRRGAARAQIDAAEILVRLELEARQALLAGPGRGREGDELRLAPAVRARG